MRGHERPSTRRVLHADSRAGAIAGARHPSSSGSSRRSRIGTDFRSSTVCCRPTGSRCACASSSRFLGIKQPTVSHHLKQLVDAGLLEREKRGTYAYYRLKPGTLERIGGLLAEPAEPAAVGSVTATAPARSGAEALGTFALVLFGCGAIMVDAERRRPGTGWRLARLRARRDGDGVRARTRLRRAHQPGRDRLRSRAGEAVSWARGSRVLGRTGDGSDRGGNRASLVTR